MRAVVVTDPNAGVAGMTLAERPAPHAAENDVVVRTYAAGFTSGELGWPATWTDRSGRDRTPTIPGHEVAGVVAELGYGTSGLSVGQRVFGLADWTRDGTLAEYVAVEARNLAPLAADIDFVTAASLPISGLTAWQGLIEHGRIQAGQTVFVNGVAGGVGTVVAQLARDAGAFVVGTGREPQRARAIEAGAHAFVDVDGGWSEFEGKVDLAFDVIGGEVGARSAAMVRDGGVVITIAGPPPSRKAGVGTTFFVVEPSRPQLVDLANRVRRGSLKTFVGDVVDLDDAPTAFAGAPSASGRTIVKVREG